MNIFFWDIVIAEMKYGYFYSSAIAYVNLSEKSTAVLILFHQKKCNYHLGNYKNYQAEYCSLKMREPTKQMLGIMVAPPLCSYVLSLKRSPMSA